MRLLKFLAVLSALGFLACVTAYGAGGELGSTKSGHMPRPAPAKDAGAPRDDIYLYSTKAGPMPVPQDEQQQQAAPPPQQQKARK
jgi:hypothetical protein